MMTYEEQEKIERLVAKDENAQKLITALRDDYHMALSQISHEIRNPLTYIDSSVQWIQKMHPEVEHFEFWSQIKNDLQYMRVLLDLSFRSDSFAHARNFRPHSTSYCLSGAQHSGH